MLLTANRYAFRAHGPPKFIGLFTATAKKKLSETPAILWYFCARHLKIYFEMNRQRQNLVNLKTVGRREFLWSLWDLCQILYSHSNRVIDVYANITKPMDATIEISKTHNSRKLYMRSHFELAINKISPINFRLFFPPIVLFLLFFIVYRHRSHIHSKFVCLSIWLLPWHLRSDFFIRARWCISFVERVNENDKHSQRTKPKEIKTFNKRFFCAIHRIAILIRFHLFLRYIFIFLEFVICELERDSLLFANTLVAFGFF